MPTRPRNSQPVVVTEYIMYWNVLSTCILHTPYMPDALGDHKMTSAPLELELQRWTDFKKWSQRMNGLKKKWHIFTTKHYPAVLKKDEIMNFQVNE